MRSAEECMRCLVLTLSLFAALAGAQGYPLSGRSSRAGYEVVDSLTRSVHTVSHDFSARQRVVRYSVRSSDGSSGRRTSAVSLSNWTRYSYNGVWSSMCSVENAPDTASRKDLVVAIGVLMATSDAAGTESVASAVVNAGFRDFRGIRAQRWTATGVYVSVSSTHCFGNLEWTTAMGVNVGGIGGALLHFVADLSCGAGGALPLVLHGTVQWFSFAEPDRTVFSAIGTCNATNPRAAAAPVAAPTSQPAVPTLVEMPALPTEFSAQIQTTLVERRVAYTLFESYHWASQTARATIVDADGSRTSIVDGPNGISYAMSSPVGFNDVDMEPVAAVGTLSTRDLFAEVRDCKKQVFDVQLVGAVNSLFLKTLTVGATFMGRVAVRDIPALYWKASTPAYTITWYFEDSNPPDFQTAAPPTTAAGQSPATRPPAPTTTAATTAAPDGPASSSAASEPNVTTDAPTDGRRQTGGSGDLRAGRVLRVTVSGVGMSPFFPLHPFLQRGMVIPEAAIDACRQMLPEAPEECTDKGTFFHHVHDFSSFVPTVDAAELAVPDVCTFDGQAEIAAYPTASNCPATMSPASIFLMMLFTSLFAGIVAGCAVYLRMLSSSGSGKNDGLGSSSGSGRRRGDTELQ